MNVFDTLVSLVFFAPLALMVAMNLVMYREERYTVRPPMPRRPAPAPRVPEAPEYDLRKAA
jgi:hypothetical protein